MLFAIFPADIYLNFHKHLQNQYNLLYYYIRTVTTGFEFIGYMKAFLKRLGAASLVSGIFVFSMIQSNVALSKEHCSLSFRPKVDELTFVPVGAPLIVADRHCNQNYLVIPFEQQIKAVHLPEGEYPALDERPKRKGARWFSTTAETGEEITSCAWCDPLYSVELPKFGRNQLCVISKLGVQSCAQKNAVSFSVIQKDNLQEGVCTPGLIYLGRDGTTLKFAARDCKTQTSPQVNYDLNYGQVIRFLNEQVTVLSADNQGIYFKRNERPKKKEHEIM